MNNTPNSLALTMKDAAKLVGVDYRTIKLGIESGTIRHGPARPAADNSPRAAPTRLRCRRLKCEMGRRPRISPRPRRAYLLAEE